MMPRVSAMPKTVIPERVYREAFREYALGLAEKWLGAGAASMEAGDLMEHARAAARDNHRTLYLTYLLPLADRRFEHAVPQATVRAMHKALYSLVLNGVAFNDHMLHRFCGLLLRDADRTGLYAAPLPEDYRDLQKLVWTFIQLFRKRVAPLYRQEAGGGDMV